MEWIQTDERQFTCQVNEKVFEIVDVVKYPDAGYLVRKTQVDLNDYDEQSIQQIVAMYGYIYESGKLTREKSDDEILQEAYETELLLPTSSNDQFIRTIQDQIIAECIAETEHADETHDCVSFDQMVKTVISIGVPEPLARCMEDTANVR